jgi:hypothetical protein
MKRKRILVVILVAGLLCALSLGPGLAQGPEERAEPQGALAVEAAVSSKFTYQGMLSEDGTPVTGTRDMEFRLSRDDTCTTQSITISKPGVEVNGGLFSVELEDIGHVNGQGLWLGIEVEGTAVGCQEILPVPYALSLRPGARIVGAVDNGGVLRVSNEAEYGSTGVYGEAIIGVFGQSNSSSGTGVYGDARAGSGTTHGVYGRSYSLSGTGVYGHANMGSGTTYGVYGRSDSSSGAGVYARGTDLGADLVLGANASTYAGDDGRITSDLDYPSSDIFIISNDNIRLDLDDDGDGEDADFEIYNRDNTLIFDVDDGGDVSFGGPGLAAFPRPAYDSGWVSVGLGSDVVRTHNLGGNADNYVVDLTCRNTGGAGVSNWGVGGDATDSEQFGAWWSDLSTTSITLNRNADDADCPEVRVRIWVYP